LIFFCTQVWLQYPLVDQENGLRVECLTMILSSSYICLARVRANRQKSPVYSCSFSLKKIPMSETM
jgi:hypothetical protein